MKPQAQAQLAAIALALVASAAEVSADRSAFEPTTIKAPFLEQFTSDWSSRWAASAATKEQKEGEVFSYSGQWSVEEPTVFPGLAGDDGLVAKSKAAQHAISAQFKEVIKPEEYAKAGKPFVVQYEAKFQKGLTCGGAYLKLLSESAEGIQAKEFSDKTPYTIMFGPDKCGTTNKVHFIFRHKHPKTGEIEEKHLVNPPYPKLAKTTNLYTLIVNPDNTYEILINNESRKKGSLFEDFEPSVNPPAEIDDPTDKKPSDWVDEQRILDPDAKKPDDWDESAPLEIPDETQTKPEGWLDDEPKLVADPDAVKPEEWDDEEDGEWIAPQVPNPKCTEAPGCGEWVQPTKRNPDYKGKWLPGYVDNPAYKGEWKPKKIPNPDFVEDKNPNYFSPIGGIGFEIWTMDEDILFDNIYVGDSVDDAKKLSDESFAKKLLIEQGQEKEEEKEQEKLKEEAKKAVTPGLYEQVREKLWIFGNEFKIDPVDAIRANPDVAGALAATVLGFFGLIGVLFGLVGGSDKAAKASAKAKGKAKDLAKKVDEPAAKAKATAVEAKDAIKKRATAATAKDDE